MQQLHAYRAVLFLKSMNLFINKQPCGHHSCASCTLCSFRSLVDVVYALREEVQELKQVHFYEWDV